MHYLSWRSQITGSSGACWGRRACPWRTTDCTATCFRALLEFDARRICMMRSRVVIAMNICLITSTCKYKLTAPFVNWKLRLMKLKVIRSDPCDPRQIQYMPGVITKIFCQHSAMQELAPIDADWYSETQLFSCPAFLKTTTCVS